MRKFFTKIIFLFLVLFPFATHAHEKWFVKDITPAWSKPLLFSSWNSVNAALVLLTIFGLLVALLFHFALRPHRSMRKTRAFLMRYSPWVPFLLRVLTGTLLFMASFSRFLFTPDLTTIDLPSSVANVLLSIELIVGLGLIIGFFPRWMSLVGFTLYCLSLFIFPTLTVLGYLVFAGIFFYLFIVGDPTLPKVRGPKFFPPLQKTINIEAMKPYALSLLRIATGISFLLVGFLYKIYDPRFALEFIRTHPVNFMPSLGFVNFSNEMFVLTAGLIEVLIGLLLIFGLLPRFIGGLLIILFTITLQIFGMYELLGHLPLYAVAFAFLTCGGGERFSAELTRISR